MKWESIVEEQNAWDDIAVATLVSITLLSSTKQALCLLFELSLLPVSCAIHGSLIRNERALLRRQAADQTRIILLQHAPSVRASLSLSPFTRSLLKKSGHCERHPASKSVSFASQAFASNTTLHLPASLPVRHTSSTRGKHHTRCRTTRDVSHRRRALPLRVSLSQRDRAQAITAHELSRSSAAHHLLVLVLIQKKRGP